MGALEACLNSEPSRRNEQPLLQKLSEAQFLVRKSERKDLYKLVVLDHQNSVNAEFSK